MIEFTPTKEFFVGIDSDGCVFDTMELKHKECFIPNIIMYYNLQGVSKYAREAAEFVNLYSKSRGINRFPALVEALEWLGRRPEVKARGVDCTVPQALREFVEGESKLGNPALKKWVEERGGEELTHLLAWSEAVNACIAQMTHDPVPPFPWVRESIDKLSQKADQLVISQTPNAALEHEWEANDLRKYVAGICGQEAGTKSQTLGQSAKYPEGKSLMIGDAPGDYKAAVNNNTLFYPINPGEEEASWKRFHDEAIDKFFDGTFAGDYQKQLLDEFESYLPQNPPWPVD
ncbi:MAG: HAD family hydrolase [Planctomycetia bacterium]|jgi:phosphoglycolate phosphatase-like HAD superfamily hydrolase